MVVLKISAGFVNVDWLVAVSGQYKFHVFFPLLVAISCSSSMIVAWFVLAFQTFESISKSRFSSKTTGKSLKVHQTNETTNSKNETESNCTKPIFNQIQKKKKKTNPKLVIQNIYIYVVYMSTKPK